MKTLTIFETSDVHGYIYPSNYQQKEENQPFGLLKIAQLYQQEVAALDGPSLLIDNGDILQGSPLSYYVKKAHDVPDELIRLYNQLPYDVGVVGNHEFNYGLSYLKRAIEQLNHPIVSANILDETGNPAFGKPYEIIEKDGIRCGILGLTTQHIPHWEHPSHYDGLTFKSAVEMAKRFIPELRAQADVVIVSYHGGFEKDLDTREETEVQNGENEGIRLLEEVADIDVLLAGHQHNHYAQVVDGTPIVMPGHKGSYLGKVTLHFSESETGLHLEDAIPELLPVEETTPIDDALQSKAEPLHQAVNEWLDQPIGRVDGNLLIEDAHEARLTGHAYVDFINQVQMAYGQVDISGTSIFRDDVLGLAEEVTTRDIVTNYIYPNTIAVAELTGAELKAALEQSAEYYMVDDAGQLSINPAWCDPKPKPYNYDMYAGVQYTIDLAQPVGSRITTLHYHGEPIKPDQTLEVAVNLYRAVGGGDYTMFSADKIVREVTVPMTELIADYIAEHTPVQVTATSNFQVIHSELDKIYSTQ